MLTCPSSKRVRAVCAARRQLVITYGTDRRQPTSAWCRRSPGSVARPSRSRSTAKATRSVCCRSTVALSRPRTRWRRSALVIATGADPCRGRGHALGHLRGVLGRAQLVAELSNRAKVFVDYAHTPDALSHVLSALRPHTKGPPRGRVRVRRRSRPNKAAGDGAIAADLADQVIVTDDNPRDEDPAAIRREILAACPGRRRDRQPRAARSPGACRSVMQPGDLLVVAGKGSRNRADRSRWPSQARSTTRPSFARRRSRRGGRSDDARNAPVCVCGQLGRRAGGHGWRTASGDADVAGTSGWRSTAARSSQAISLSPSRAPTTTAIGSSPMLIASWCRAPRWSAEWLRRASTRTCRWSGSPDPLAALRRLGAPQRGRGCRAPVMAVTGSVGKTGTKEALRGALDRFKPTHASVGSFNNHWGVPLSLARCRGTPALRCLKSV